jgi:hypothetical protein
MILYHFTPAERVEQILTEGLLPASDSNNMVGGAEVVWLTERTDLVISASERVVIHERSGRHMTSWLYNPGERPMVRLAIRIPSQNRRLVRYRPWLRKHRRPGMPDPNARYMNYTPDTHWIYFGQIPPSWIVEVDKDHSNFSQAETLIVDIAVAS